MAEFSAFEGIAVSAGKRGPKRAASRSEIALPTQSLQAFWRIDKYS
jgi:hypothetical protein